MAADRNSKTQATECGVHAGTLYLRSYTRLSRADLFHSYSFAEEPLDEGGLELDGSNGSLTIPEHSVSK